jgi:ABC-type lipoprotein export system ATPase subunit
VTEPVVVAHDLHKGYRRGSEEVRALGGVSFSLYPGEVTLLAGPSGSGKSTVLNLLTGWEAPDRGEIKWAGRGGRLADMPWSAVGIMPQALGLMDDLSVRENVLLPVRFGRGGGADTRRAGSLLAALGLDHLADRQPWEISLGEQQRAALARALVLAPEVLLADEPTGHQDAGWGRRVLRVIRFAAQRGTACLVASHNEEAVRGADRVLSIRDGLIGVRARSPKIMAPGERPAGTASQPESGGAGPWRPLPG